MTYNVQSDFTESSQYLIQWINIERQSLGKNHYFSTFDQILEQGSLYQILKNIDPSTFQDFSGLKPRSRLDIVEQYLEKQFGKRIKWGFKQSFGDFTAGNHIKEFAKLVCYLCIYSKKKNQYISRILNLDEENQRSLMEEMQLVEKRLENITEIREIIEQIYNLEEQNEKLKCQLEQMMRVNSEALELLRQSENENKILKTQNEKYRLQKCQVFNALQIDYISEYLDAYNRLKAQNENNIQIGKQLENKLIDSESTISILNNRIKSDCLLINSLNDEVAKLKEIQQEHYKPFFDQISCLSPKYNAFNSKANNKENIGKSKMFRGKSPQYTFQASQRLHSEEDQKQKASIRIFNQQMMVKLENMYKNYNMLTNEMSKIKQQNKKLEKSNLKLRRTVKEIETCFRNFEGAYKMADQQEGALKKISGLSSFCREA